MNSVKSWRAGAILVLVGGVALTVGWIGTGVLPPLIGMVGDPAVALGLILAGVGIRRRYPACLLLMVAGGSWLLEGAVFATEVILSATRPALLLPRWVFVATVVIVAVATVAAAIGMIVRGRVVGVARWILVLPAVATTVMALGWTSGIPAELGALVPWALGAPNVAPLVVGVAWLFVRDDAPVEAATTLAAV